MSNKRQDDTRKWITSMEFSLSNSYKNYIPTEALIDSVLADHNATKEEELKSSVLGKIFKTVWESTNESGLPFEVLTNMELYKKSIIDADFITAFIEALKNNVIIVPIKIVNITDLNMVTYNHSGHIINGALKTKFGIRMYVSFYLPSLDSDQINSYYNKDHIYLELDTSNAVFNSMRKDILNSFKALNLEMEQVSDSLNTLVKTNPEYHKMVYDKNKAVINLELLKQKIKKLNDDIYRLESGVLSDNLIEKNTDNFKRERVYLFNKFIQTSDALKNMYSTSKYAVPTILGESDGMDDFNDDSPIEEDYINFDEGVYIDFEQNAHHISNLTEDRLNDLLDDDLMSVESFDTLKSYKGFN